MEQKFTVFARKALCLFPAFLMFLVLLPAMGTAQTTVDIGTGTQTAKYPLGNEKGYERSLMLYTPEEIGGSGTISKIEFYGTNGLKHNVKIYIGTTSNNGITSQSVATHEGLMTLVNEGSAGKFSNKWDGFTLNKNTPFVYDGTSNLLVLIENNYGSNGGGTNTNFRYTTQGDNSKFTTWENNGTAPTGNGTASANRPNIRLSINNFKPTPCNAPLVSTASNVRYTSANLNWLAPTTGSAPTGYEVQWSTSNIFPNPSTSSATTPNLSYSLNSLVPNMTYYYRVRTKCSANLNSSWSDIASFKTGDYSPIEVTGFNQDAVANIGKTVAASTTAGFDNNGYVFPENGYSNSNGTSIHGLPTNRVLTNSMGTALPKLLTYLLQPYNENNNLRLARGSGTLTFPINMPLSELYIAGLSGEGAASLNITVDYATGDPQTFSGNTLEDWYATTSYVYSPDYRVSRGDEKFDSSKKDPKIAQLVLTGLDSNREVTKVTFTNTNGNATSKIANIMAVSGKPEWARITSGTNPSACFGEQVTLSVTGADATRYKWYKSPTGGTPIITSSSDGSSYTFTLNNATDATYYVAAVNDAYTGYIYENPQRFKVEVLINSTNFESLYSNDWSDYSNWSANLVPNSSKCVKIPAGQTVIIDIPDAAARNITVEAGGHLSISANRALKVVDFIHNDAGVDHFIVENNASLLQENGNALNTGDITVKKEFNFSTARKQYNYVISPVKGQAIKSIYPDAPFVIYHREDKNFFYNAGTGAYDAANPAKGFAIKESQSGTATQTALYKGAPFNGDTSFKLTYTPNPVDPTFLPGYNLIGNPYPSNLDIEDLYDNNSSKIDVTFEFWDNRGNTLYEQQGSGYNGDSYAKYNAIADIGVGAGTKAPIASGTSKIPNRYVKVGTAFMVRAKSNANNQMLNFTNSYRSKEGGPSFFGRNAEDNRFWLTLTTPSDFMTMTAITYLQHGSNDLGEEDSKSGEASNDIFTMVQDTPLAIQGRTVFTDTDIVNLGINTFADGLYKIAVLKSEGVFDDGQKIYLKDKVAGLTTAISDEPYFFTASAGTYTNRFEIMYKPETLGTDNHQKSKVEVYKEGQDIVIRSGENLLQVEVYDPSGRLIYHNQPMVKIHHIAGHQLAHGMYIIKIKQTSGNIVKRFMK